MAVMGAMAVLDIAAFSYLVPRAAMVGMVETAGVLVLAVTEGAVEMAA